MDDQNTDNSDDDLILFDFNKNSIEDLDLTALNNPDVEILRNYIDILCAKHDVSEPNNSCFKLLELSDYPDDYRYVQLVQAIRETQKDILLNLKLNLEQWEKLNSNPDTSINVFKYQEMTNVENRIVSLVNYLNIINDSKNSIFSTEMSTVLKKYGNEPYNLEL